MGSLKKEIEKIKLSEAAKHRILQNCREKLISEQENNQTMKKNNISKFKKPFITAAALAVVLSLTGITAMATTGTGFFKDEVRFDGAITGQSYYNATDEILVYAAVEDDFITVTLNRVKYTIVPYSEIELELLELKKYRVYDESGNVVMEDAMWEDVVAADNQVIFKIPAEGLAEGNYKLVLDVLSGSKKADPAILIYGEWECEFTK